MNTLCSRRMLALLLIFPFLGFILACATSGVVATRPPRWACPSPTPLPWGADGPVKAYEDCDCRTDPLTGRRRCDECPIFFAEWEREYPDAAGPPFPSPTPYALTGLSYVFDQRVEVWPVHALVSARAGTLLEHGQQLYLIDIAWHNHSLEAFVMPYAERVRLRAVTTAGGAVLSDAHWGMTARALDVSGLAAPPDTVPPGASQVTIPVIAPAGEPETVDVVFDANPAFVPALPTSTTLPGTPTATPAPVMPTATPAPNDDLRAVEPAQLTVQWSNAEWRAPQAEPCDDPGALTDWSGTEEVAWGMPAALEIAAPPGTSRLIQIALNQVGKPYIWGAKGPEAFDCSGLMTWSYAQIGLRIPHGTAGQWPGLSPVEQAGIKPGDLVYFAIAGGRVDHVGMLVGDLNGDSSWDMVHAASPQLGVRVDYGIFESAYYRPRIVGFRTVRQ